MISRRSRSSACPSRAVDDDDDELEGFPGASGKEAAAAVPAGDAPKEGGIDWDIGAQSTPTEGGESPGGESPGGPVSIDWNIGDVVVERVGGGESIAAVPIAAFRSRPLLLSRLGGPYAKGK